jgi:hypothetical protein
MNSWRLDMMTLDKQHLDKQHLGRHLDKRTLVQTGDELFAINTDVGEKDCICSRCHEAIPPGMIAVRVETADSQHEYRYHPKCVGLTDEPIGLDDPVGDVFSEEDIP